MSPVKLLHPLFMFDSAINRPLRPGPGAHVLLFIILCNHHGVTVVLRLGGRGSSRSHLYMFIRVSKACLEEGRGYIRVQEGILIGR
jgi:hypothetical protein